MTTYALIDSWPHAGAPTLGADSGSAATASLRLVPSGDGWSLIDSNGWLVFSALGVNGRRRCVEFAGARGVLVLHS